MIQEANIFQVFVGWDDDPSNWQLTYSHNLFQNCRLATLQEVKENAHRFADPGGFVDSTNDREKIVLADGLYTVIWEEKEDSSGFLEYYLYFLSDLDPEDKVLIC